MTARSTQAVHTTKLVAVQGLFQTLRVEVRVPRSPAYIFHISQNFLLFDVSNVYVYIYDPCLFFFSCDDVVIILFVEEKACC